MKLDKKFYRRDVHKVAKELLGKIFIRVINDEILSGRIVEVEAYDGSMDESAHSYRGKTKRNEVMFNGGGFLYVYFTYGMHFCANVVTGKENEGKAVLIRAIEPLQGIERIAMHRYKKKNLSEREQKNLTNGPAKICSALKIGRAENGISLLSDEIYILDAPSIPVCRIEATTRIGIKKSVELNWRYLIRDNPFVSVGIKK